MNYAAGQFALNVLITLINILIFIYNVRSNKEKVTTERFQELEKRMGSAETKIKSMPVCSNHGRMEDNDRELYTQLRKMTGDISELLGGVNALTNNVDMLTKHLLSKGGP